MAAIHVYLYYTYKAVKAVKGLKKTAEDQR